MKKFGTIKNFGAYVRFIGGVTITNMAFHRENFFMEENHRIPCMRCKHYYTTFDPKIPRGCKLYQFQSATMPYVLVKQSTGKDCPSFEEKAKKGTGEGQEGGNKDFNDPKYWG